MLQVEKDGVLLEKLVKVDKSDGSRRRYVTFYNFCIDRLGPKLKSQAWAWAKAYH